MKIGRCEVPERSRSLPNKKTRAPRDSSQPPFWPKWADRAPNSLNVVISWPLHVYRIWSGSAAFLPDLFRNHWFFGPKSRYNNYRLSAYKYGPKSQYNTGFQRIIMVGIMVLQVITVNRVNSVDCERVGPIVSAIVNVDVLFRLSLLSCDRC